MPVPLIGAAISAGVGLWGAHKQAQAADQGLDLQKQFLDKQSGLASQMTDLAKGQFSASQPAISKAMNYYSTLAGGGRGATNALLAPQVGQAEETYRGAERGMTARMSPGGGRDQAIADLYRQRAGQLSMMPMAARSSAVGNLAELGTQGMNRGMSAMSGAGSIMSGATGGIKNMADMGDRANAPWSEFGKNMGSIFLPYLMKSNKNLFGGGGGGNLPSFPLPGGNVSWGMPGGDS